MESNLPRFSFDQPKNDADRELISLFTQYVDKYRPFQANTKQSLQKVKQIIQGNRTDSKT